MIHPDKRIHVGNGSDCMNNSQSLSESPLGAQTFNSFFHAAAKYVYSDHIYFFSFLVALNSARFHADFFEQLLTGTIFCQLFF